MKKEKTQPIKEKRSVTDFEHRMTVTLEPKHYINYAMTHSRDQIKKARKRAIFWAIFFFVLGAIALFKGASMEGSMADIYLVAGILMIVYQLFNLFYHFVMFPVALKRSVSKELKKDPRAKREKAEKEEIRVLLSRPGRCDNAAVFWMENIAIRS